VTALVRIDLAIEAQLFPQPRGKPSRFVSSFPQIDGNGRPGRIGQACGNKIAERRQRSLMLDPLETKKKQIRKQYYIQIPTVALESACLFFVELPQLLCGNAQWVKYYFHHVDCQRKMMMCVIQSMLAICRV